MLGCSVAVARERNLKWKLLACLVGEVQVGQRLSGICEGVEIGCERNAREFLGKVVGESVAVRRGMEDAVYVVEDRVLGDVVVVVARSEGSERCIRDVVYWCEFGVEVVKDAPGRRGRPILGSTGH